MGMILYLLEQKALFIQKTIKEVNNRQNRWLYKKYISNRWLVNVINVENRIDFHQKINEEIEYLSKEKRQEGIPLYEKPLTLNIYSIFSLSSLSVSYSSAYIYI